VFLVSKGTRKIAVLNKLTHFLSYWRYSGSAYLVSMLESRPNTIGRGPDQVGATAAMAVGFTKPFFAARTVILAACLPPSTTKLFSSLKIESYWLKKF
jgi:hypothetical protein